MVCLLSCGIFYVSWEKYFLTLDPLPFPMVFFSCTSIFLGVTKVDLAYELIDLYIYNDYIMDVSSNISLKVLVFKILGDIDAHGDDGMKGPIIKSKEKMIRFSSFKTMH